MNVLCLLKVHIHQDTLQVNLKKIIVGREDNLEDQIGMTLIGVNMIPFIRHVQFTEQDKLLHPEYDNDKYLDSMRIEVGTSYVTFISFGYQLHDEEGTFIWIEKSRLIGVILQQLEVKIPDIKSKQVICPECGKEFKVVLLIGNNEFKDGYHGECPKPHCGFRYFEELVIKEC